MNSVLRRMRLVTVAGLVLLGAVAVMMGGCGPRSRADTDQATATETAPAPATPAAVEQAAVSTPTLAYVPTPEPTAPPPSALSFWTTETQPGRVAVYEEVARRFMDANPGMSVEIVPVAEASLVTELNAAATAGQLPDVVRIGVERLPTLAAAGLLQEAAAFSIIDDVGRADFRPEPLAMVGDPESGLPWAVPYDGWTQAIWFRRDRFEQWGLSAPTTWAQLDAVCDALAADADPSYALALPSDPTQNYAHQLFEQFALSNNAWPFDADGRPAFDSPQMVATFAFYTGLARCSLPGPISVEQAADAYLRGETSILFYSTYIMDDLVEGVERSDGSRTMPVLDDLAQRTSFVAGIAGNEGNAAYGQLVTLAVLRGADPAALRLTRYFLTDGYLDILALAPFGKVPVLESVATRWTELSPIFANYSPATLGHIANGYATMRRWVLNPDYGNAQRAAIGAIESNLLIPQAIDRILQGEMTAEEAAAWLQSEVEALMAQP